MKAKLLYPCMDEIGEAATWLDDIGVLLWVDINSCILHEFNPSTNYYSNHILPTKVSTIVPTQKKNEIILALSGRLVLYHLIKKELITITEIEPNHPNLRPNDGKASPEGRLWLGIMHQTDHQNTGSLCCIEKDLTIRKVLDQQCIPNGIVWNKTGTRMYYTDSGKGCINEYAYDPTKGEITFLRIAIQVPSQYGVPDGMTIDDNGFLWVAHWGGFGVYIWNPLTGKLENRVEVPVPNVASCTFGGKEKNQLFITTARAGLTDEEKVAYPSSGSLFIANVNTSAGINHYPFTTH